MKKLLTAAVVLTGLFLLTASIVLAQPSPVAKTGQTKCYDASGTVIPCEGTTQDGEFRKGVASPIPRFKDNGDGTVTDNLTGLVWVKDISTIMWFPAKWSDALGTIDYLNASGGMGSCGCGNMCTDWRVPNIKELQSLIDFGNSGPALPNGHLFEYMPLTLWASTTKASEADAAWLVDFYHGFSSYFDKNGRTGGVDIYYFTWPVRGGNSYSPASVAKTGQTTLYQTNDDGDLQKGVSWPDPRFTDNGDGTVTDNLTGLVWLKNATVSGDPQTWQSALGSVALINALGGAGSCGCGDSCKDWRLPNVKELESLIDFGNSDPGLPIEHPFTNVGDGSYWSSTSKTSGSNKAWIVDMDKGFSTYDNKTSNLKVWPVRGGN